MVGGCCLSLSGCHQEQRENLQKDALMEFVIDVPDLDRHSALIILSHVCHVMTLARWTRGHVFVISSGCALNFIVF